MTDIRTQALEKTDCVRSLPPKKEFQGYNAVTDGLPQVVLSVVKQADGSLKRQVEQLPVVSGAEVETQ